MGQFPQDKESSFVYVLRKFLYPLQKKPCANYTSGGSFRNTEIEDVTRNRSREERPKELACRQAE